MATASDVLVPALREVREAEAALADRFRAHAALTPAGPERQSLERHSSQARRHVRTIDERVNRLQPKGLVRTALGGAWGLTGWAVRLPLEVAMAVPAAVRAGRAGERQKLRNAQDEYAATAVAVAAGRAAERIARQAGDITSSALLETIRHQDEDLLQELGESVEEHADAVVTSAAARGPVWLPGAGQTADMVRGLADQVRQTAGRWGRQVQGAATERTPGVPRSEDGYKGAVVSEVQVPIPHYDRLSTAQILEELRHLSQVQLEVVDAYERARTARSTVLARIDDLREPEPWPGYDTMSGEEIRSRLLRAEPGLAGRALEYERRHRARATVLAAAGPG